MLHKTDVWLSIVLFAAGLWAWLQSRTFDDLSRAYPQALSAGIIALAVILFIEAVQDRRHDTAALKSLGQQMIGGMLILGLFMLWALLLATDIGYLLSSFLIVTTTLWLLGMRRFGHVVLTSSGIVVTVFILFQLILDVPLPLQRGVQSLLG